MAKRITTIVVPSADGAIGVKLPIRTKKQARADGKYLAAIADYAVYGRTEKLERYRGRKIVRDGETYERLTDLDEIDRGLLTGELHFEDLNEDFS